MSLSCDEIMAPSSVDATARAAGEPAAMKKSASGCARSSAVQQPAPTCLPGAGMGVEAVA